MRIEKVGVAGCGLMGSGIAQVTAMAGHPVVVRETEERFLASGFARIEASLAKFAEKGKITPEQKVEIRGRLKGTTSVADLAGCDLVIEAIVEDLEAKKAFFRELGRAAGSTAIFASNTSSFPIGELGESSGRPDRFLGLHFFNPVPLMKLVEVVRATRTSEETVAAARAFVEGLGKAPVLAKDTPGFIVNRLLVPYLIEAIRMVERGEATKEDVDTAMKLGCGYPMGPIELLDYVGLDTTLAIVEGWHRRFPGEKLFEPPALLRDLVKKGLNGRKFGRGFYEWEGDRRK
ncbi:MAG TPA: 3-hydroxyacyl-CoA dehydrogenase family protein [Planctomycetota bacterium]|jgi:3-hydroxybutyryl-CoA dehydrogenase|nr:3-hydroxyacyl-CoA dehydrogenase family protein [Planctomycetota bacterium]